MHEPPNQTSDLAPASGDSLEVLRRFAHTRPDVERCELCSTGIAAQHPHLLDRHSRQVACSCNACAILFADQQNTRFLRVPRRLLKLDSFRFTDAEWDAMTLPIGLAFFVRDTTGGALALYPSPAGIMESLITLPPWSELTQGNPTLATIEPEVEALVVHRIGDRHAYFLVPVDTAYRLVGLIRMRWRGLSGGPAVWQAIAEFFEELERTATLAQEKAHA